MANRDFRTGTAREDWNLRARENYRHAIATYVVGEEQEEAFRASGETDASELLAFLGGGDVPALRVLEYGCGVGRLMVPLSRSFGEIRGIDISDEMVRIGRERGAGRADLHFHVLEDGKLPFPDGSFDLVYSLHVFQHMPRPALRAILPELARVLRPNGRLVFQLTRPYTLRRLVQALSGADRISRRVRRDAADDAPETYRRRYYTKRDVRRLLEASGLRLVRRARALSNPRHHYHLAVRPRGTAGEPTRL